MIGSMSSLVVFDPTEGLFFLYLVGGVFVCQLLFVKFDITVLIWEQRCM